MLERKRVVESAMEAFVISLCTTEIELFKERENWKKMDALTAYFQSTPQKAAFGRLMTRAALVTQCYNVREICEELNMNRQSVYRMVKECLDANWIKIFRVYHKGRKIDNYIATQELIEATEAYARYLLTKFVETKALGNGNLVHQLRRQGYL
tara:strand:- start:344 stop:802 length:459 start_codon:yes stop_codon:yes gene_type:complete